MHQHASVNRIYRLVWNEITGAWVAVAETSRRRGKRSSRRSAALLLSLGAVAAHAGGPTGGQVTAGSGSIAQAGNTTTINQSSQTLSLSWQSFNIAPQQTVDFAQPSSTAVAVNRILGTDGSVILGHLNSNGQVYLINPNGIIFGKSAQVNVGGLVASTLDLNPSSAGNTQTFSGTGSGRVLNQGSITAANGGSIALLANHVDNTGTISAQLGTVALGAGSAATLTFSGTHLVSMQVDQSVLYSEASNGGLIRADGGAVIMTAGAQKALLASVVNNTGVIEARTVHNQQGTITLLGGMSAGTVNDSGTIDASAPDGGNGGSIDTSAAHVQIANSAKITTAAAMGLNGTWTIDPQDFTIAASGGDETGAQLSSALGAGNVIIDSTAGASGTKGNINVNDAVTWSSNKLTLTADNDVNINAVVTANNTAKLDLEPGSGNVNIGFKPGGTFVGQVNFFQADGITPRSGTGFLTINGNGYTVITSLGQQSDATTTPGIMTLQGIASVAPVTMSGYSAIPGYYALGANINASATSGWNSGAGFTPIGVGPYTKAFGGAFDGLGHVISNLTINRPNTADVGLFAFALGSNGGFVRNVGLTGVAITGTDAVGALVGYGYGTYAGTFPVRNSYATGTVSGATGTTPYGVSVGGLIGSLGYGSVTNSHAAVTVSANGYQNSNTGGLVGTLYAASVNNSYATGAVSNIAIVGSAATNSITGGLVGLGAGGTSSITNSFATGNVTANRNGSGGLVGYMYGSIANSYSTGNVTGGVSGTFGFSTGGLVGFLSGALSNSYETGTVIVTGMGSAGLIGGLVGTLKDTTSITNSFWNATANGSTGYVIYTGTPPHITVTGSSGLTSAQMMAQASYVPLGSATGQWDFANTWVMYEGQTTPLLQVFMTPLTASGTLTQTYNASAFAPTIGNLNYSISSPDLSQLLGTLTVSGSALGASHAGTYTFTPGGLYSDQLGYMISYTSGTLTITPASVMVSGTTVSSKVYNGSTNASLTGGSLSGLIGNDSVTLTQSGSFATKNAGSDIAVTATDSLSGADAGDYTIIEPMGLSGSITPASLTVSGSSVGSKVYNGTTSAPVMGGTLVGLVSGDTVTLNQSGTFVSANVGSGIAVTATDGLGGADAGDYSIIEPTGLSGSITPASSSIGSTGSTGSSGASSALVLAALNARAQTEANFTYPQLGATPQVVSASPTIQSLAAPADSSTPDATSAPQTVAINVSMRIGATGTLKIESGGLRLPSNLVIGNE